MSSVIKENQIFGHWKVLGEAIEHPLSADVKYYRCRCTCGKEKDVREASLINKLSTSCGCKRQKNRKELNVGAVFGSWQIVNSRFNSEKNDMYYYLECSKCEEKIEGFIGEIYKLMNKNCSCNLGPQGLKKGTRYGSWVIQGAGKKSNNKAGGIYYLCKCDCGTLREVVDRSLKRLLSTSCGCSRAISQKQVISVLGRIDPSVFQKDINSRWKVIHKDISNDKKIFECLQCNIKIEVNLGASYKKCPICAFPKPIDKEKLIQLIYEEHNLSDTVVEDLYFEIFTITRKGYLRYILSDGKEKYPGNVNLSQKRKKGNPHKGSPVISIKVSNIIEKMRLKYEDQYIVDHKDDLHPLLLEVDLWDLARMLLQGYFIEDDGIFK